MGAPAASIRAVVTALLGNGVVTLLKFGAFFLSGSGAMLSEGIHSAADTANQVLLYVGLKRGAKAKDEDFPYGYGGERFVFGLLSAAGIFFVGCGVTVYHGVHTFLHPAMPALSAVTFAVLGISLVIEGGVLVVALMGLLAARGGTPFWRFLREKADPAAVAILLEDSAAVLGVLLAAGGIGLAYFTGNARWDALSSILIGLLLGAVALYLVAENRKLLLGRAVPDDAREKFVKLLQGWPSVREVHDVKTRLLTPEVFKLKAEIAFDSDALAVQLEASLSKEGVERRDATGTIARHAVALVAREIDLIEEAVRKAIPEARHIDIEVHGINSVKDDR
jgi:zinc transporter 9